MNRSARWGVAGAAMLFVAGFTLVFAAGMLGLSDLLITNERLLQRIGGVVTIAMGLVFLGFVPALQRDVRIHRVPRGSLTGAPVLGAVYRLGWTPCLGPTLTGVIALASGTQIGSTTARGIVLVLAYCANLGIPFVLLAQPSGRESTTLITAAIASVSSSVGRNPRIKRWPHTCPADTPHTAASSSATPTPPTPSDPFVAPRDHRPGAVWLNQPQPDKEATPPERLTNSSGLNLK